MDLYGKYTGSLTKESQVLHLHAHRDRSSNAQSAAELPNDSSHWGFNPKSYYETATSVFGVAVVSSFGEGSASPLGVSTRAGLLLASSALPRARRLS